MPTQTEILAEWALLCTAAVLGVTCFLPNLQQPAFGMCLAVAVVDGVAGLLFMQETGHKMAEHLRKG